MITQPKTLRHTVTPVKRSAAGTAIQKQIALADRNRKRRAKRFTQYGHLNPVTHSEFFAWYLVCYMDRYREVVTLADLYPALTLNLLNMTRKQAIIILDELVLIEHVKRVGIGFRPFVWPSNAAVRGWLKGARLPGWEREG